MDFIQTEVKRFEHHGASTIASLASTVEAIERIFTHPEYNDLWSKEEKALRIQQDAANKVIKDIEDDLRTMAFKLSEVRAKISSRYVPTEGALKAERDGFETGRRWGDRQNEEYVPGGPYIYTCDSWRKTRDDEESKRRVRMELESKMEHNHWFMGFRRGILERIELGEGLYVAKKVKEWAENDRSYNPQIVSHQ